MKTVLLSFFLFTATVFLVTATLAFFGVLKERMAKGKADDDMATGMLASIAAWMLGGLFLFFAYLAS